MHLTINLHLKHKCHFFKQRVNKHRIYIIARMDASTIFDYDSILIEDHAEKSFLRLHRMWHR